MLRPPPQHTHPPPGHQRNESWPPRRGGGREKRGREKRGREKRGREKRGRERKRKREERERKKDGSKGAVKQRKEGVGEGS